MKKNAFYAILLSLIVGSALYYQYQDIQSHLEKSPYYANQSTLRDSTYLDGFFFEKYYNDKLPRYPFVELVKGSEFLFYFDSNDSTLFYHVLEDSPSDLASVKIEKFHFNIPVIGDRQYARLEAAQDLRAIVGKGTIITLGKQEITQTAHRCDDKMALVFQSTKIENMMMDLWYFPISNLMGMFIGAILIWGLRRFSFFIGSLIGRTEVPVLSVFVALFMVVVPLSAFSPYLAAVVPSVEGFWDVLLSFYGLYKLLPVALFFLFRYSIKKYKSKFDFVDLEVLKYAFIVIAWVIYVLLDNYLLSLTFSDYENEFPDFQGPFLEGIMCATANFLNNFRAHYFELRRKGKSLLKAQSKALESTSELAALNSRVNPHFLYNSMNSIAALAEDNPTKTKEMALALSEFYKYSSNRQDDTWTTIGEEMQMIEKYLEIERIRFGDKLRIKIQGVEATEKYKIPRFLIHPLVENAIKYGYSADEEVIEIVIELSVDDKDSLSIDVEDTGPDFPEDLNMGYGLKSIYKKLKLTYPNSNQISFINKNTNSLKSASIVIENPRIDETVGNS